MRERPQGEGLGTFLLCFTQWGEKWYNTDRNQHKRGGLVMRLLFKGGTVVTGKGPRRADIPVSYTHLTLPTKA